MAVLSGQTCVALYPYVGEPGQKALSFAPGDAIRVRSTTREGWWEGEKEGQRGWFPASYVQLLEVRPTLTPRGPRVSYSSAVNGRMIIHGCRRRSVR